MAQEGAGGLGSAELGQCCQEKGWQEPQGAVEWGVRSRVLPGHVPALFFLHHLLKGFFSHQRIPHTTTVLGKGFVQSYIPGPFLF